MKIIVFILAVFGLVGFCVWQFSKPDGIVTSFLSGDKKEPAKQEQQAKPAPAPAAPETKPAPADDKKQTTARIERSNGTHQDTNGQDAEKPFTSSSVQFHHRTPPDNQWFQQWATRDVVASVDPQTRTVTLSGSPRYVLACAAALKQLDQPQGSCAVQSWCVYVDASKSVGWDILGAIRDVSGSSFALTGGPGSVTFDLSTDRLAGTLRAIADGQLVEVVQNPYLKLTHGSPATIEAIQEFPIAQTVVSNGVAQSGVDFRKVGLQFVVQPRFLGGEKVALDIKQANGVLGSPVKVNGNEIPVVETQTVASTVELQIGQAVLLGGVKTSKLRHSKGLLRDTVTKSEGVLYVLLSTSSEIPKAMPAPRGAADPFGGRLDNFLPESDSELKMVLPPLREKIEK